MVQFLSIIFFSSISSIFVGFFKSSRFFVSLCIIRFSRLSLFMQSTELHLYISDGRVSSTELPPVQRLENFYGVTMSQDDHVR